MKSYNVAELMALDERSVTWIDVRPAISFIQGYIKGSRNAPFNKKTPVPKGVNPMVVLGPAGVLARKAALTWDRRIFRCVIYRYCRRFASPQVSASPDIAPQRPKFMVRDFAGCEIKRRCPERIYYGQCVDPIAGLRRVNFKSSSG